MAATGLTPISNQIEQKRRLRRQTSENSISGAGRTADTRPDVPGSQILAESLEPSVNAFAVHAEVALSVYGATVYGERGLRNRNGDEPHRNEIGKAESSRTLNVIGLPAFRVLHQQRDTWLDGKNVSPMIAQPRDGDIEHRAVGVRRGAAMAGRTHKELVRLVRQPQL